MPKHDKKMTLYPNCKRIIIEGYTSFDIQGVNLREEIEKFAKSPDKDGKFLEILGSVENLKDGRVEVIYTGNDEKSFHTELEQHLKEKKFKIKNFHQPTEHYHPELKSFTGFTIKRADDISEMVLALRGAGYRFVQSTETLQKIHKSLIDRDNREIEARLVALHHELLRIIDELTSEKPNTVKLFTEVIKSHVVTPVIPKEEFVNQMMIVFVKLEEFVSSPPAAPPSATWMDDLRKDLDELRKMVDEELDKIRNVKI